MLGLENLRNVEDLNTKSPALAKVLINLEAGEKATYKNHRGQELAIREALYKLGNGSFRLLAFQDIKAELQAKELEAWQNLTKVLRHEIMNSIAPISSLTATLSEILAEDLVKMEDTYTIDEESVEDITEGLSTISGRSLGLINFVNAYRDYTNLPTPEKKQLDINNLTRDTIQLMKRDFETDEVELVFNEARQALPINADPHLIEQVLINLVKNAREAVVGKENPKVVVTTSHTNQQTAIVIEDNGTGITAEAMQKIFMPFYSTKKRGSGIGLSLSKQIMQMHGGDILLESELGKGAKFTLIFGS